MPAADLSSAILGALHLVVTASAYAQFRAGHLRDSVFNAFVDVFDLLREKSGLGKDGAPLVAEALSLERPKLILSTLATESGQNVRKGSSRFYRVPPDDAGSDRTRAHTQWNNRFAEQAGYYEPGEAPLRWEPILAA
jgi:hypothetical protein